MEDRVEPGIDDAGVVLKNAVEHFDPVLGEFPGALEIVFPVLLFGLVLSGLLQVFFSAAYRIQQSVNLAL
jgi:hypothetical protein